MALRLPYLQVTQEAWDYARQLAALSGRSEADAFFAVCNLWRWGLSLGPEDQPPSGVCDSPRADRLLLANLGSVWVPETVDLLVELGLVERTETGLRVRGMDRYLRTWMKNKRRKPASGVPVTGTNPAPSAPKPAPQTQTQTQTQIEDPTTTAPPASFAQGPVEAPTTPPAAWLFPDFWRYCQSRRQAGGLLPEKLPDLTKGAAWWSACLMEPGITPEVMVAAFNDFGRDPYWERPEIRPHYPFRAFVKEWRKHVPRGAVHAVA